VNEETKQTYKLISDDGDTLRYEGGYWMDYNDYYLFQKYPGKFIVGYDKQTKKITLTYNPFYEKSE
jgi:hypothetical protein